jgi:hypothetical protein
MSNHVASRRAGLRRPTRAVAFAVPAGIESQTRHDKEDMSPACPDADPAPLTRASIAAKTARRHGTVEQSCRLQYMRSRPGTVEAAATTSAMPAAVTVRRTGNLIACQNCRMNRWWRGRRRHSVSALNRRSPPENVAVGVRPAGAAGVGDQCKQSKAKDGKLAHRRCMTYSKVAAKPDVMRNGNSQVRHLASRTESVRSRVPS